MARRYFTAANSDGYSDSELDTLNRRVGELIAESGIDEDDPRYDDAVKNACDQAHNEFDR